MARRRRRRTDWSASPLDAVVEAGVAAAAGPAADAGVLDDVVTELVDRDGHGSLGDGAVAAAVDAAVGARLHRRWEDGWEPLDIVHVVGVRAGHRVARLAAATVVADPVASSTELHVPEGWRRQVAALAEGAAAPGDETAVLRAWRIVERLAVPDALEDGLRLAAVLALLPPLEPIDGPPSAWGPHRAAVTAGTVDGRVLRTVRALLAKAESTGFPAEAEAFTAKAQDLMARHAIDAAVVAAREHRARPADVAVRRIRIEEPYGAEKAQLLHAVGDANDVVVVWLDDVAMATAVGFPLDVELVEVLFTSLLVQATAALARAGREGGERQPPTFRRAFLVAFADRVADRLEQARAHARDEATATVGAGLVPLLAERRELVEATVRDLFGELVPGRARSFDGWGWAAGREAAERVDLRDARHPPLGRSRG